MKWEKVNILGEKLVKIVQSTFPPKIYYFMSKKSCYFYAIHYFLSCPCSAFMLFVIFEVVLAIPCSGFFPSIWCYYLFYLKFSLLSAIGSWRAQQAPPNEDVWGKNLWKICLYCFESKVTDCNNKISIKSNYDCLLICSRMFSLDLQ